MTTCELETLKGLVDSTPNVALLIHLHDYYAQRPLPEKGVDSEVVYECPRTQMMIRTAVKGTTIGTHFHTVCDEYVIVTGGKGEIMVNGEWKAVKVGDVHVCPGASSTTPGPWRRTSSTCRSSRRTFPPALTSTG